MGFEVMSEKCDQCLLGRNPIVGPARIKQLVRDCRRDDASFICHKSPSGREIVCRGHFDTGVGQMARIAGRLRMIVEVNPVTLEPAHDPS